MLGVRRRHPVSGIGGRLIASKTVERNADEIEKYLEVLLPKLEPAGGIPEVPLDRKYKGKSRPPVSEGVMALWQANPHAGKINAVLTEAAATTETVELIGREMWKVLSDCLFDHTAIRRWKAEGGKDERRFWMLCRLLAQRISDKHGAHYRVFVHTNPEDEQRRPKTREGQKRNTSYTDRRIVQRVEALESEENMTREQAKKHLASDPDNTWSYWRVERAITAQNKEGAA